MPGNGQGSKGTKVSTVPEADQGEGDEDQEDGFFVDVPAKEEGGVGAQSDGANKRFPVWLEEEANERDDLEEERESECCAGRDLRQDCKAGVANQASSNRMQSFFVDRELEVWRGVNKNAVGE